MDPAHELPQVKYAGFWKRFAAYLIDTLIVWAVLSGISPIFGVPIASTSSEPPEPEEILFYLIAAVATWLYFSLMESSRKQGTLGKMALGIIVTDEHGGKITFARATGRHFAKIISGIIIMIGYLMAGWTKKKQALHDMIAKTLVIKS